MVILKYHLDKIKKLIDFHKVNSKDTDSFMVVHKA